MDIEFEDMTSKLTSSEKKRPLVLFVVPCMKSLVELCGRNAKKGKKLQMGHKCISELCIHVIYIDLLN